MTTILEDAFRPSPADQFVPLFDPGLEAPHEGAASGGDDRPVVVIVDDERAFLDLIQASLRPHSDTWQVLTMNNPEDAWEYIRHGRVDAVITDLTMPGMSGFDLLKQIRGHDRTHDVPVTILTGAGDGDAKQAALDFGATDLLTKPFHPAELVARLKSMLRLKLMQDTMKERNHQLEDLVAWRTRELTQSRLQIIWKLAKAAEFRDEETGDHVVRVALTSARIARTLGLPRAMADAIYLAAPLHDIGKIGIPDSILLKPGKLTSKEQQIMRQHCELGFKILSEPSRAEASLQMILSDGAAPTPDTPLALAQDVALCHHECWDGSGYPRGLTGDEIPLAARIVAVADVYDALRSSRPYKFPLSRADALEIIRQGRDRQFDPRVVDAFLECEPGLDPRPEPIDTVQRDLPDPAELLRHFEVHAIGR